MKFIMKRKYAVIIGILFLSLMATESVAEEIEEIVVVGATETYGSSQPEYDNSLLEAIDVYSVFQPGGPGGFAGVSVNGTDVKHTAVFRNGVPVNDPGGGWFDFGTELPTFQNFTIISGPNSVLFGSSAMAGTILMEDTFSPHFFTKGGDNRYLLSGGNEYVQLAHYKGSNGSARTDNDERDWFENTTLKTNYQTGDWKMVSTYQDYSYDYDNCWFGLDGNDCVQEGEKIDMSIRNNWLTVGYAQNDVEHNTGWEAKSKRYFVGASEEILPGLILGGQAHRQEYNEHEYNHTAGYLNYSTDNYSIGWRLEDEDHVFRFGYEKDLFKFSVGNSIRMPNLYERYGDDWVAANPNIKAEKGNGITMTYGFFSAFYYDFSESIDFDMNSYGYVNSGGYESKGMNYSRHFLYDDGALHVNCSYTDTDQIRAAKYETKVSWFSTINGWDYLISYVGQHDRGNDFDGTPIEDVSTFDFNIGYYPKPGLRFAVEIRDILNREFEILPYYGAGGREINLTLHLSY
mgnify:FL=1|tara:strand:- start:59 stop:1606 length:1548 start_codon:yes stop_codon:yes gene_type:complete